MTRPYVTISGPNLLNELMQDLNTRLPEWMALDGVCGITLNGGCSRGYADDLSEIDLVFYLQAEAYSQWTSGHSPLPLGITRMGGALYDIKIVNLEEERQRRWESVALWDLSYARILYDPSGNIAGLIQAKLANPPKAQHAEGTLFNCWWHFRLAGDIWLQRGDAVQGHSMLNTAAALLIEALFTANGEYVPHAKWLIHLSRTLPWTPPGWDQGLRDIMSTGDLSRESLSTRQAAIDHYWKAVDAYIIKREYPDYPLNLMHKTFYDLIRFLLEHESVTLEEWTGKMGLSMLSSEPFIRFTSVAGDRIIVNKQQFMSIRPDDLYAWHYAITGQILTEQPPAGPTAG